MSKRTGSEVQENRETKKQKSDESTLKTVLADLFEVEPETNELIQPATDEEVKKLEDEIGLTIPASYKQLLKFTNGGELKKKFFKLEDGSYAHIGYITGIHEDDDASVLKSKEICQTLDIGSNYAILSGENPEYFALDFNTNAEDPAVVSILHEDGLQITKLAPNFETFLCGLEAREEDMLCIALKSTIPADQLEATITTKLKEAGIEIKTEEQLLQMRAEQMQLMMEGEDTGDEDDLGSHDEEGEGEEGEGAVGARINNVRDLGDSGEESDSADGDIDGDGIAAAFGGDFGGFDFASDDEEDDLNARQVTVTPIEAEDFPKLSAVGFNLLFTFAMITDKPYDELSASIKDILRAVEGVEQIEVVAEPVDSQSIKHSFC